MQFSARLLNEAMQAWRLHGELFQIEPFFFIFHASAFSAALCNRLQRNYRIIQHGPSVSKWNVKIKQIMQTTLKAPFNLQPAHAVA